MSVARSFAALVVLLAACASGSGLGDEPLPPAVTDLPAVTAPGGVPWPDLPDDGVARALVTPSGLTLPVNGPVDDDTFLVQTPCGAEAVAGGTPLGGAHVVLDPGHGGEEPGAVSPDESLREADVNLSVSQRAAETLRALGATVVLTRDTDVRVTVSTRARLATVLQPAAFISVHHNAEPDGASTVPGSEVYFQIADARSRRLAGLLYEELQRAFSPYPASWASDVGAGALARVDSDDGTDWYGVLRESAGVPAVLSEAAYISNPAEAGLLALPEFQQAEGDAIARAVVRFVATEDPGSGYAADRTGGSSGSGGTAEGCVDPPLS